jgi:hypothetical protein
MQRAHPTAKPAHSPAVQAAIAINQIDVVTNCHHAVPLPKCPVIDSTPQTTQRVVEPISSTVILEEVADPIEFEVYGLLTIDQAVDLLEIKAGFTRRQAIAHHVRQHLRALTRVPVFHPVRGKEENHLAYPPRDLLQLLAGPLPTVDQWQAALQRSRKERAEARKLAAMLQVDRDAYLAKKAVALKPQPSRRLTEAGQKALKILARDIPKKKAKASPSPQHRTQTPQPVYRTDPQKPVKKEYPPLARLSGDAPLPEIKPIKNRDLGTGPRKLPAFERR